MSSLDLFPIAPTAPDAIRRQPDNIRRAAAVTGCSSRRTGPPQHPCSEGDGDGDFSSNSGRTWQCRAHRGPGFPEARAA
jgi:hypothetical protein